MDTAAYLERIGEKRPPAPTLQALRRLHRAHLCTVPFENLSIHTGETIALNPDWLFRKIVERRRGGFCYELNGLFGALLSELGYRVQYLSARVYSEDSEEPGPEFDHLVLQVDLERPWLADVGFGRGFLEPLDMTAREDQNQDGERYLLKENGDHLEYLRWDEGVLKKQYRFSMQARELADFKAMCRYHQTSPESPFTRRWLVTMATREGRQTLYQEGDDFRWTTEDRRGRHTVIVHGRENADILLGELFGIHLPVKGSRGRR